MSRRRHGPGNLARVLPAIDLDAPPSAHPGPAGPEAGDRTEDGPGGAGAGPKGAGEGGRVGPAAASPAPGPAELLRADALPGLAPALPNEDAARVHAQRGARARTALRAELGTIYAQQDPDLAALRDSLRPKGSG